MQPYQQASEAVQRQTKAPFQTAKNIASLGATPSRMLPFLQNALPAYLAVKGLSKLNPRIGKFINGAINTGHTQEEALDFMRKKANLELEKQSSSQPKQNRNIIEQYSPELHQFITDHIGKGKQPLEAGALAQLDTKFKNIIKKMEQDHQSPFSALLQSTYGGQAQPQQQVGLPPQFMQALDKIMSM